jgi:hypothetical protein
VLEDGVSRVKSGSTKAYDVAKYEDRLQTLHDVIGESELNIKWAGESANGIARGTEVPGWLRGLPPDEMPTFARMFLENNRPLLDNPAMSVTELVETWTKART